MSQPPNSARDIFLAALDGEPADRTALLDELCAGDAALRHQVEMLLQVHDQPDSFLDNPRIDLRLSAMTTNPHVDRTMDQPISEKPGSQIGPYKLLQEIGEGGFGVVYMAQQNEPVERRVALKIIKPGMDTHQVIARFEAEEQALAMMDHPNIAKVYDAGMTASGRPYFVMELVHGVPITQYCDQQHLTPNERLDLFVPVCHAVQHAHQKGIIHRDLKPSNVLIALYDDQPVPKVIDFGVAKATSQKLTEKTMFTQFGQVVRTLEYMSPEQANLNQWDVDTRSDIYSLGVLLYELLTGTTPLDRQRLHSAAFDEMLRIIREEEPPKPSTRLSTIDTLPAVAANRKIEPKKLSTLVRGELDWIVMKALEKDRARRYETANGLANDIQRYLHDEPVVACPPSALYRFRKFTRKNRRLFMTAAAVTMALLAGTAVATWQAVRATQAQHLAEQAGASQEAQRLQAEANMHLAYQALDKIYLQVVEEDLARYPERLDSYRRVLEDALRFYSEFAERNADDARVQYELAVALARAGKLAALLDQHDEALDHLRQARSILEPLLVQAPTRSDYQRTLFGIYHETGQSHRQLDQFDEAAETLDEAGRVVGDPRQAAPDSWVPRACMRLGLARGSLEKQRGRFAESERSLREALEFGDALVRQTNDTSDRHLLAKVAAQLGILLSDQGQCEAAEPCLAQAQSLLEALLQETPDSTVYRRSTALLCLNRGANLIRLDRIPEARPVLERGIELAEKLEQEFPGDPEYSAILVDLENNLDISRSPLGNADPDQLARTLDRARRTVAARPAVPEYQEDLARCLNNHAVNLEGAGRLTEALAVYSEGLDVCEKLVQQTPQATRYRDLLVRTLANRGDVYAALGHSEDAEKSFRRAIDEAAPLVASTEDVLAYRVVQADTAGKLQALLRTLQRGEEAEQLARKVIQQLETIRGSERDSTDVLLHLAGAQLNHGNILHDLLRYPEALAAFERAARTITDASGQGESSPQLSHLLALSFENRGEVQRTLGNFTQSDAAYRESMRLAEKLIRDDEDNPQHGSNLLRTIGHLAELYSGSNRLADAEPELTRGIEVGERLVSEFPKIAGNHRPLIDLMSYQIELQLTRSDFRAASVLAARSLELADAAVALAPDDPGFRDLPRQVINSVMAVAEQANDLPTQHRALSRPLPGDGAVAIGPSRASSSVLRSSGHYGQYTIRLGQTAAR